jgi:hypothetical protein
LRWATGSENQANRKISKFASSDYKGVSYHKPSKKWLVHFNFDKKCTHVGLYEDEKEAAHAYNYIAKNYYGDYAKLNVIL